jgi:glycosyltransferase involved in cell wall biosynthesis
VALVSALAAIPLILLACLGGACGVYYGAVWWRIVRVGRTVPTLREGLRIAGGGRGGDGAAGTGGSSRVCVIVPAHNERDVIAVLAKSLCLLEGVGAAVRVVFVLDRCTDDTEAVLRAALDAGCGGDAVKRGAFEIIINTACPEGWAGKTHALWRGVCDSDGAKGAGLLCFADADTSFDPRCLVAAVALMKDRGLDLLSVLSTLEIDSWFERVAQPAAGIELVRQFPLDLVNRHDSGRAFANGQFMLFRRESYDKLGGHERVKGELLEDLALARRLMWHHKDMRLGVFMADGLLRCRMYRNWPAFRRGWKRIYTEAVRRKPGRLRGFAWRLRLIGSVMPLASALGFIAGPVVMKMGDRPLGWALVLCGGAGAYAFCGAIGRALRAQHAPAWLMVCYPAGAWLTASILADAARDLVQGAGTQWGGKNYTREIRA